MSVPDGPAATPPVVVPLEGRGTLPMALLHGEPLLLHPIRMLLGLRGVPVVVTADPGQVPAAREALSRAGLRVEVVAAAEWWAGRGGGAPGQVVLVDALCPLVPADFVTEVLGRAESDRALAAYRPVTDTVKTVVDEQIAGTLDRDALAIVVSPVVVPAAVAGEMPPTEDFSDLVGWLRDRTGVELVKAPSMARRVGEESAVQVLEALDELGRRSSEA